MGVFVMGRDGELIPLTCEAFNDGVDDIVERLGDDAAAYNAEWDKVDAMTAEGMRAGYMLFKSAEICGLTFDGERFVVGAEVGNLQGRLIADF